MKVWLVKEQGDDREFLIHADTSHAAVKKACDDGGVLAGCVTVGAAVYVETYAELIQRTKVVPLISSIFVTLAGEWNREKGELENWRLPITWYENPRAMARKIEVLANQSPRPTPISR